jgi:hypothetical protein
MNLSNPKPQKQHPPTRKGWESPQILATILHLFSSSLLFSSQLPIKRKPSNRSNQDRQKKQENKGKKGERGPGGESYREKRKAERKKRN